MIIKWHQHKNQTAIALVPLTPAEGGHGQGRRLRGEVFGVSGEMHIPQPNRRDAIVAIIEGRLGLVKVNAAIVEDCVVVLKLSALNAVKKKVNLLLKTLTVHSLPHASPAFATPHLQMTQWD